MTEHPWLVPTSISFIAHPGIILDLTWRILAAPHDGRLPDQSQSSVRVGVSFAGSSPGMVKKPAA